MSCLVLALTILQLVLQWHASVAEAATPTAKPGCQQNCGKIQIPYPFGIGNSSCFHDDWFEVVCLTNTTTTPFLKKLDLEVIGFQRSTKDTSAGWYLSVNNPKMTSPPTPECASGTGQEPTSTPLDFTGSPFRFSSSGNIFAGSGCKGTTFDCVTEIWMVDSKGKQIPKAGCTATSLKDTNVKNDCCKIDIDQATQFFNVSFTKTSIIDDGCKYAALGAIDQWPDSCSFNIKTKDYVPAWIDWGLKASTPEGQALLRLSKSNNTTIRVTNFTYDDGSDMVFALCADGFQGSAYLTNGCEDVDECTITPGICTNGTCENTIGFYKCNSGKTETKAKTQIYITVACAVVGVLVVILGIWLGFKLAKRRQERKYFIQNGGLLLDGDEDGVRVKTYKAHELRKATNNFSKKNLLGKGGQGAVYTGTLKGGTVAIKLCKKIESTKKHSTKQSKGGADKSREAGDEPAGAFITEVNLLSKTLHINIVKLMGCCLETEFPMLVYEHLVNGDLAHHLRNDKANNADQFTLSWEMRLRIAVETAEGLSYLHRQAGVGIYHRDVKTDNILLDNKYTAKLADFGISQSVAPNKSQSDKTSGGSAGYTDPEYSSTGQYTDKSDVYSFGVVLAELLTGRRPISSYTSQETGEEVAVILADHFKTLETAQIMSTFLDARVKHQGKKDEVEAVIEVAKRCLEREGRNRLKMKDVVLELEKIRSKQTEVYAEEIEEHDFEAPVETVSPSPKFSTY